MIFAFILFCSLNCNRGYDSPGLPSDQGQGNVDKPDNGDNLKDKAEDLGKEIKNQGKRINDAEIEAERIQRVLNEAAILIEKTRKEEEEKKEKKKKEEEEKKKKEEEEQIRRDLENKKNQEEFEERKKIANLERIRLENEKIRIAEEKREQKKQERIKAAKQLPKDEALAKLRDKTMYDSNHTDDPESKYLMACELTELIKKVDPADLGKIYNDTSPLISVIKGDYNESVVMEIIQRVDKAGLIATTNNKWSSFDYAMSQGYFREGNSVIGDTMLSRVDNIKDILVRDSNDETILDVTIEQINYYNEKNKFAMKLIQRLITENKHNYPLLKDHLFPALRKATVSRDKEIAMECMKALDPKDLHHFSKDSDIEQLDKGTDVIFLYRSLKGRSKEIVLELIKRMPKKYLMESDDISAPYLGMLYDLGNKEIKDALINKIGSKYFEAKQ